MLYLYSCGVESIKDPDAVGHVPLQSASTDNHVPHRRCVGRTDVHLTGKRTHCQDLVAGNRQRRLHAAETPIHVILQCKVTISENHTELVGEDQKPHFSNGGFIGHFIIVILNKLRKKVFFLNVCLFCN